MDTDVRRILHVDMDAFYASVEQRERPQWKGHPLIVAGDGSRRGVVAAASYEARAYGIHSAMPTAQALRLCPEVIRVPPRHSLYSAVSRQIFAIFESFTPLVEPLSLDESYLDVSEHCRTSGQTAVQVAREIKRRVASETGLTATAGVAPNKFVAKVASGYRKPDGLTVVVPKRVREFLHPLPIGKMWGVGPVTRGRLEAMGIQTIGDLAGCPLDLLQERFGRAGVEFARLAQGLDDRPVVPDREPRSLSAEETFARDIESLTPLLEVLAGQAEEVFHRLERWRRQATTVVLKLRYGDFTTVTRSHTLSRPFRDAGEVEQLGARLLAEKTEAGRRPVRLLGLGLAGLRAWDTPVQLELFQNEGHDDVPLRAETATSGLQSGASQVLK